MGKYDPLEQFLDETPAHLKNILLSFSQIEQVLGRKLPPNAYNPNGTWWRNSKGRPQSQAWLAVGWKQDIVSWREGWVRFRRQRDTRQE